MPKKNKNMQAIICLQQYPQPLSNGQLDPKFLT